MSKTEVRAFISRGSHLAIFMNAQPVLTFLIVHWLIVFLPAYALTANPAYVASKTASPSSYQYRFDYAFHHINKFGLSLDNFAGFGWNFSGRELNDTLEYFIDFGGEYPKGELLQMELATGPWIGAIIDEHDTLVSTVISWWSEELKQEFWPEEFPFGELIHRSTLGPDSLGAVSEEDWIATIIDTVTIRTDPSVGYDWQTRQPHKPLGLNVRQESYAWSYGYAEDLVLFNYIVSNIGTAELNDVFFALSSLPEIRFSQGENSADEVCGHISTVDNSFLSSTCSYVDSMNLAWVADNDGDPFDGIFTDQVMFDPQSGNYIKSVQDVLGLTYLNTNPYSATYPQQVSFNWFISMADYGPRKRADYRNFGTGGTGAPLGDRNKYYMMRTPEIDFPSVYTAQVGANNEGWLPPPPLDAPDIADGAGLFTCFSIGPYQLSPGASITIPVALVAGENFHVDPNNGANLPNNPDEWMRNVDFSDLVKNTLWAQWIYDNPGVDTDGDGYFGSYHVCVIDSEFVDGEWVPSYADTIWYRGDGVPDWKGAGPPPAPTFKVTQLLNGLKITFNGERSETEKDIFSRMVDFEGYRIYIARDDRATSYSRYASYDTENYDIWAWNKHTNQYDLKDIPLSLDSLRCRYGFTCDDSAFNPLDYTSFDPYNHPLYPDSIYYFTKHDYNASELGVSTPIKKVYPNTRDPRTVPADQLTPDDYTEDGQFKFFEYECEVIGLLSSVPYWVNVTAFDFGSPKTGLSPLETSITLNAKQAYAASSQEEAAGDNLKVYVYPNPYRIDADYRSKGFEGRTRDDFPDDKVRQLNFANLPYQCTIRVYTLDGDLVVEKKHDADPSDPTGRHDYWSLINRNRQIIVSGLYYWTVEEPNGNVQMGKFMVIR